MYRSDLGVWFWASGPDRFRHGSCVCFDQRSPNPHRLWSAHTPRKLRIRIRIIIGFSPASLTQTQIWCGFVGLRRERARERALGSGGRVLALDDTLHTHCDQTLFMSHTRLCLICINARHDQVMLMQASLLEEFPWKQRDADWILVCCVLHSAYYVGYCFRTVCEGFKQL